MTLATANVVESIRADAAAVLKDGRAKAVLGYRIRHGRRIPLMVTDPARVNDLMWDEQCAQNLATYLRKPEVREQFPAAVVATPPVMRSLILLTAESQIQPENVLAIGIGLGEYHGVMDLAAVAALLKDKYARLAPKEEHLAKLKELAAMSAKERAAFWTEIFENCTRCYACRAACPNCYCQSCLVERNQPQWISTVSGGHGSFAWNMMRAYHQAGRCTLCGACEAACPQGLPLGLLNAWIELHVEDKFDYRPGYDPAEKPLIGTWKTDDDDKFVK